MGQLLYALETLWTQPTTPRNRRHVAAAELVYGRLRQLSGRLRDLPCQQMRQEVVQEVAEQLVLRGSTGKSLPDLTSDSGVEAWLFCCLRNRAVDLIRADGRHRKRSMRLQLLGYRASNEDVEWAGDRDLPAQARLLLYDTALPLLRASLGREDARRGLDEVVALLRQMTSRQQTIQDVVEQRVGPWLSSPDHKRALVAERQRLDKRIERTRDKVRQFLDGPQGLRALGPNGVVLARRVAEVELGI
jgi:DNA-directed RNA polymerase specialized sigma24 family protein